MIPELQETLVYTRSRIEEAERESFMLMKQVKERMERQRRREQEVKYD